MMRLHWSLILHISTWLPMSIKMGPMSSSCPVPYITSSFQIMTALWLPICFSYGRELFLGFTSLWKLRLSKMDQKRNARLVFLTPILFSHLYFCMARSLKHLNLWSIDLCIYSCAYITFLKLPCCQRIFPMLWNNWCKYRLPIFF